jgi:hypothetical protein
VGPTAVLDMVVKRKRLIGIPTQRWEDIIKTDFTEIGCEGVKWIHLTHDRVQWEHGNKPSGSIKGGEFPNI